MYLMSNPKEWRERTHVSKIYPVKEAYHIMLGCQERVTFSNDRDSIHSVIFLEGRQEGETLSRIPKSNIHVDSVQWLFLAKKAL